MSGATDGQHAFERTAAGVYGVDIDDPGADTWTGRYLLWASSADEAARRLRAAGFDRRRTQASWDPGRPPPDGLPHDLGPATQGWWFRSRLDDQGWTAWQALPPAFNRLA